MKEIRNFLADLVLPGFFLLVFMIVALAGFSGALRDIGPDLKADFLLLTVPDAGDRGRAGELLAAAGFAAPVSVDSLTVGLSNFYQIEYPSLEEVLQLKEGDPRQSDYLKELAQFFGTDATRMLLPLDPDAQTSLASLAQLEEGLKMRGLELPWIPTGVQGKSIPRILLVLVSLLGLVLLAGRRGHLASLMAPIASLGASLCFDGIGLSFGLIASCLYLLSMRKVIEECKKEIERGLWFRYRRKPEIHVIVLWKVLTALPPLWKIYLAFAFVFHLGLLLVAAISGSKGWVGYLAALWVAPFSILLYLGIRAQEIRRREHPLFTFAPLVRQQELAGSRVLGVLLIVLAFVLLNISIGTRGSRSLETADYPDPMLAARHDFFQTWFAFGLESPNLDGDQGVYVHRYWRESSGQFHYELQELGRLSVWLDEWQPMPGTAEAFFLEMSREMARVVIPQNMGVYSTPEQFRALQLLAFLCALGAFAPLMAHALHQRLSSMPVLRRSETIS